MIENDSKSPYLVQGQTVLENRSLQENKLTFKSNFNKDENQKFSD